ncbi:hypothetical protein Anas_12191 [Armadillidium nasatum]|uniref:Transmembrane protein n=1 Tax=Armadillidium nasatum TaxID=96803 RepID=A0A5N5T389_9CRUS|nr:hypothetical protein Anas_12191 [Armadillidium nasatum]
MLTLTTVCYWRGQKQKCVNDKEIKECYEEHQTPNSLFAHSINCTFSFISALYGAIFPGEAEAAFSNYRLWESVGFILSYLMSGNLCTHFKIYIRMGLLFLAMIGYYLIEIFERKGGLDEVNNF